MLALNRSFLLLFILSIAEGNTDKKLPTLSSATRYAKTSPSSQKEIIRPRRYLDYLPPPPATSYYKSSNAPMYSPQYNYNDQYYNYYRPPTPYVPNPYMYSPQPPFPNYYAPRNPPTSYNMPMFSNRGYNPFPYSPEPYVPPPIPTNYYNAPMYPMPMPNYPMPPSYSFPQPPPSNYDSMSMPSSGQYDSNPPYQSPQSYQAYQSPERPVEDAYPAEKLSQLPTAEISSRKDMNNVKKESSRAKV